MDGEQRCWCCAFLHHCPILQLFSVNIFVSISVKPIQFLFPFANLLYVAPLKPFSDCSILQSSFHICIDSPLGCSCVLQNLAWEEETAWIDEMLTSLFFLARLTFSHVKLINICGLPVSLTHKTFLGFLICSDWNSYVGVVVRSFFHDWFN